MSSIPCHPRVVAAAALGFALPTMAMSLILVPLAATPVIVRGQAGGHASAIAIAFAASAIVAIVAARRIGSSVSDDLPWPLTAGMAAAGFTASVVTVASAAIDADGPGPYALLALAGSAATLLIAVPAGRWLCTDKHLGRIIESTIDTSAAGVPRSEGSINKADFILGASVLTLLTIGLVLVVPDGPFGHDESIYALKARSWVEGTPDTGWAIYRPLGLSWLGVLVLVVSDAEIAFRTVAIVLSGATIGTMFAAGRVFFDRSTAIVGTLAFMSTASFLRRATEFLNDVVAAGFLLAAMMVIWFHFERHPRSWWLLLAAPFGAGAYYFRYGSAVPLALIAVVAALTWHRSLLSSWRQILGTAGLLGALLIPHFVLALDATGSPLGIFATARTAVGGGGGGLADYIGWLPSHLAGPVGTALLALSLAYTGVVMWRSRTEAGLRCEAHTVMFTVTTAIVVTIALGAFTHGEPRFIFLPLMLALVTGARAITQTWRLLAPRAARVTGALALVVLLAGFAAGTWHMATGLGGLTDARSVLVESSEAIRTDAAGAACVVRSSYVPQLTWYSECATYTFSQPMPEAPTRYFVLFSNGKRQPTGADLDQATAETEGSPFVVIDDPYDRIGDASIYRYP